MLVVVILFEVKRAMHETRMCQVSETLVALQRFALLSLDHRGATAYGLGRLSSNQRSHRCNCVWIPLAEFESKVTFVQLCIDSVDEFVVSLVVLCLCRLTLSPANELNGIF
jgi:hypothetical protein